MPSRLTPSIKTRPYAPMSRLGILTLMHWLATVAFVWSLATGLRLLVVNRWAPTIAPAWVAYLPQGEIFTWHVAGGWAWLAVGMMWGIYCRRQLTPQIVPRRSSKQLTPRRRIGTRLRWYNHLLVTWGRWLLLMLLVSGLLLWTGWIDGWRHKLLQGHLWLGALVAFLVVLHAVGQWLAVSTTGLTRLFWTFPAWQAIWQAVASTWQVIRRFRGVITASLVVLVLTGFSLLRLLAVNELLVGEMKPAHFIAMDGVLDDAAWRSASAVTVVTRLPGGDARVPIEVRALRQGLVIHFAFSWPDATQSLHHLPLIKTAEGWKVMHDGFERHDERTWYEDKLAVAFAPSPKLAGNGSILLGAIGQTLGNLVSERGTHVATNGLVDLWHWKSVRNHETGVLDDSHFGKAYPHVEGASRYTGGYLADPSYVASITYNWQWFRQGIVIPKRLPRDPAQLAAMQEAFQQGKSDVLRLPWHDTEPYDAAQDNYPLDTVLPSVLWLENPDHDRADVAAVGHWQDGRWTVEARRALSAESELDLDIGDGTFLWLAAFDHAQSLHSYHLRPLRLRFQ